MTQLPSPPFQAPLAPPARPQDPPSPPPPAHGGLSHGQAPQPFEPFRPFPAAAPTGGPQGGQPPLGPPSQPFPGPSRQPPRRHDRDRAGTPLALWVILLVILLGGGATAGVLLAHPFSRTTLREAASTGGKPAGASAAPARPAASGATSPAPSPTAPASPPAVTEQQAATSVATMLSQSVSDRAAINNAYNNVLACNPQLASAPTVFNGAASSRQKLLASLGAMPGRDTLPPALLSDLTQAWQASIAADQAFAQWAGDELASCTPNDTGSAAYQATVTPNSKATRYKTAFVTQWNPIAAQYNLTQYQQGQL